MNRLILPVCLTFLLVLAACRESGSVSGSSAGTPPTPSEEREIYPRTVWWSVGPGSTGIESSVNGIIPDLAGEYFGKLNWAKPEQEPSFGLEFSATNFMRVQLTKDSTPDSPEFVVFWIKPGGTVVVEGARFPIHTTYVTAALRSEDAVLDLLKAFAGRDESFQTAVEWTDVAKQQAPGKPTRWRPNRTATSAHLSTITTK